MSRHPHASKCIDTFKIVYETAVKYYTRVRDLARAHTRSYTLNYFLISDTDSLILSAPDDLELPVPIGNAYGEWKHEVSGDIQAFHSLGPKNYCLVVKEKDGTLTSSTKARGFFIKDKLSSKEVNAETLAALVHDYLEHDRSRCKVVPQFNIRIEGKTKRLYSETSLKVFRNDIYNKRVAFRGSRFSPVSLPFGYSATMLKRRNIPDFC